MVIDLMNFFNDFVHLSGERDWVILFPEIDQDLFYLVGVEWTHHLIIACKL